MNQKFCQSCGMPLNASEDFGTNADQSKNDEYCTYCFKNGEFTEDITMDEMIEHCVQYLDDFNKDTEQKLTKEQAVSQMKEYFPTLKRWASA
ncbi:zinc ribbon domain-containing protein [Dysgonomonas sp. GY75]|nr:zinc ribbon domain-containing protein [Dysgonomonas sp. GY75]MBF0648234.1 zinc ribbon domain-containing protein [Dysgonomonas sp. GY75]